MRYLVLAVPLALLAGCIVRPGYGYRTYQPVVAASAAASDVYYYGNHFIPDAAGGGWCYVDGPHTHDYVPDRTTTTTTTRATTGTGGRSSSRSSAATRSRVAAGAS